MTNTELAEDNKNANVKNDTQAVKMVSAPQSTTPPRTTNITLVPPTVSNASSITPRSDEGSVRDLEAAMTRHLPEEASDFSTDALLRGTTGHRSTIQWVGGQQGSLPASTLLRQLYANRESVIRTSIPKASYYPDVQAALPTPPGPGGYQETVFPKSADFLYNSSTNPTANGALPPSSYSDYHPAMTPPSSVSPREKIAECNDVRSTNFLSETPAQPLPLKPQVYSYSPSTVTLEGASYPSALTDQPASLYSPPGFHLYHSNSSKTSGAYDALRSGSSWYSPAS